MKIQGVKWNWSCSVSGFFRREKCPVCGKSLKKRWVSRIVDSRSPEAKDYDFSAPGGGYYSGKVKIIWRESYCPRCDKTGASI